MDTRRLSVWLVLSLFLVSSVFAAEGSSGRSDSSGSAGVSVDVTARGGTSDDDDDDTEATVSAEVKASAKVSESEAKRIAAAETGGKATDTDTDTFEGKTVWEIEIQKDGKEADVLVDMETGAVLAVEWEEDDDTDDSDEKEGKLERMEGKLLDIRARQKAHVEASEGRCAESKKPENCKRAIENRLEAIAKLEQKDLELLEKLREKRVDIEEKQKELKVKALKKFDAEGKARVVAKAKVDEAERAFKEAKDKFNAENDKQKADRKKFVDVRTEWKEKCASDTDAEGCAELEARLRTHLKDYLVHTLGSITGKLEELKTSIQSSETLSEEEAKAALADVEAQLKVAAELSAKVEALNAESTQKDIDGLVKDVRELWNDAKHPLKLHGVKVVNSRMGGVLVRSERMNLKLAHVLERMTEKGVDTTAVDGLVAQYNQKLTDAETSYKASQDLLKEAARLSGEKRVEKVQQAHAELKKAQVSLKEAHDVLRDIHAQLKKQRQTELLTEVEADTALTVG